MIDPKASWLPFIDIFCRRLNPDVLPQSHLVRFRTGLFEDSTGTELSLLSASETRGKGLKSLRRSAQAKDKHTVSSINCISTTKPTFKSTLHQKLNGLVYPGFSTVLRYLNYPIAATFAGSSSFRSRHLHRRRSAGSRSARSSRSCGW